ncbi:MAG: class I SAM-dependent methyltransferase [bacterium]
MNCFYCDKISSVDANYNGLPAEYDIASAAPRCSRHWRYLCGKCGQPAHFMSSAYCQESGKYFCSRCASNRREVAAAYWVWEYYFEYQSPWSGEWCPSLDRLEFEKKHPLTTENIFTEQYLTRYPSLPDQWRSDEPFTDDDVQENWSNNALRWDAGYDADGDRNRRYQSDEPMLNLLGDLKGCEVLDVGCGAGYLCRKLTRAGAKMTGVELSEEFMKLALKYEAEEAVGINYLQASISTPKLFPTGTFDKAVSNYVLMDVLDYEAAIANVYDMLKPGGIFIVVISHPAFACGPGGWVSPVMDTPRREERTAFQVDNYFIRGAFLGAWGNLDPVLSFHRPLRDYWQTFTETGFTITGFEEPSITERGRRELPLSQVHQSMRIPYSCIFRLKKR